MCALLKKQRAVGQGTPRASIYKPTLLLRPETTHAHSALHAHMTAQTENPPLGGGCPKVYGPEGQTQKVRKQLGVREVLGLVMLPHPGPLLIELLLLLLFYPSGQHVSIWFPLFLCWHDFSQDGRTTDTQREAALIYSNMLSRAWDLFGSFFAQSFVMSYLIKMTTTVEEEIITFI